ncbi:MAG: hypothetical protein Q9227_009044 [Pyrenula ochraceoflavens]
MPPTANLFELLALCAALYLAFFLGCSLTLWLQQVFLWIVRRDRRRQECRVCYLESDRKNPKEEAEKICEREHPKHRQSTAKRPENLCHVNHSGVYGDRINTTHHAKAADRIVNEYAHLKLITMDKQPQTLALISVVYLLLISIFTDAVNGLVPQRRQSTNSTGVLDVFQVYKPVFTPPAGTNYNGNCVTEQLLMDHVFAFSYGMPFIGPYNPPSCSFNAVTMTLTVTSAGRQFDRLGLMYFGDIEIFRTSTAEPTANGIIYTYTKDMTAYLPLWQSPQTIIFDLGNLIDSTYTASFNTTLTATFFTRTDPTETAELILPISAERGSANGTSAFNIPGDNSTAVQTIPTNVTKALVSISACGQSTEEFWYSNVLSSYADTFTNSTGTLYGFGAFREIQLLIDGYLAGVVWPFPIIFTGGIVPGFWRPIVGIDAFDLREPEIDITPFLPYLTDGAPHSFSILVRGVDDSSAPSGNGEATLSDTVGTYWVATGKIFLFTGSSNATIPSTPGVPPTITTPAPQLTLSSSFTSLPNGTNLTLTNTITASRSLDISSSAGSFSQSLTYSSFNLLTEEGLTQRTTQSTSGSFSSDFQGEISFSYPLDVNSTYTTPPAGGVTISGSISRGLSISADAVGQYPSLYKLVPGALSLGTTQDGTASYSSVPNASYSFGDTTQHFSENSLGEEYERDVRAVNGTVVMDSNPSGLETMGEQPMVVSNVVKGMVDVRGMLGRGPGVNTIQSLGNGGGVGLTSGNNMRRRWGGGEGRLQRNNGADVRRRAPRSQWWEQ